MSGIINKAKVAVDKAIHPDKHHDTTTGTHTTGTHTGAHTGTHTGTTGTGLTGTGHHNTTSGPHDSNIANKADPRVDSDRDGSHLGQGAAGGALGSSHTGTHSGALDPHTRTTAGPHNSDALNKADPRVDSDRDGANFGQAGHSTGTGIGHNTGAGYGHSSTGTGLGSNTGSTNAGPHNSNALNKLDPRVDSDRDGANFGQQGHTTGGGLTGTGHSAGTGIGSHTGSTNAGPHNTNTANKLDPRVDSDRDGANFGQAGHSTGTGIGHNTGTGYGHSTGTGLGHNTGNTGLGHNTGTGYGSTNAGPHDSNLANKADPRIDSDRDGSHLGQGAAGYGTTGHGTAGHGTGHSTTGTGAHGSSTTAGPHNSNVLNKLDPRVDSDLDGSKTVGGNKTYSSTNEPFDAARHGPSEARAILGEPDVQHPHDASDHQRRHSLAQNDARNIFK